MLKWLKPLESYFSHDTMYVLFAFKLIDINLIFFLSKLKYNVNFKINTVKCVLAIRNKLHGKRNAFQMQNQKYDWKPNWFQWIISGADIWRLNEIVRSACLRALSGGKKWVANMHKSRHKCKCDISKSNWKLLSPFPLSLFLPSHDLSPHRRVYAISCAGQLSIRIIYCHF